MENTFISLAASLTIIFVPTRLLVAQINIVDDGGGFQNVGQSNSVTIGGDGLPLISYMRSSHGLRVAHCDDVVCSSATFNDLEASFNDNTHHVITTGTDGFGLIVYRLLSDELRVAHCENADCSSFTATTVDVTVGGRSSIAIGSDGMGLISYGNAAGDLKVAHCNDTPCTSVTVAALDTVGSTGIFSSVTVGGDGLELISYYDEITSLTGNLKVAHCDNIPCSSATTTVVDTGNRVGTFTTIRKGTDGFGLISYSADNSSGSFFLKKAHCLGKRPV